MRRVLPVLAILALLAPSAQAQRIPLTFGVLSQLMFTDNLNLSPDKESGGVLQLLPNVAGANATSRTSWRLYYGPSALFYSGGTSDTSRVFHVFQGDASIQLIDQYLGLMISARANQNLTDSAAVGPDAGAGFDALGNPDAFAQTASVSIAPVIRLPVVRGDFATLSISPGINYVFTAETSGGATNQGDPGAITAVTLTSGEYFSRMPWSIDWSSNVYNSGADSGVDNPRRDSLNATLNYRIDRRWTMDFQAGYDYGDYDSTGETQGARWSVGPTWTPSAKTSVSAGYGERYFGGNWYLDISHVFKKLAFSLQYATTLTDARTALLNDDVVQFEDPFGQPTTNIAASQQPYGTIRTPALNNQVYVQQSWIGNLDYTFGRSTLSWQLQLQEQEYRSTDLKYSDFYSTLALRRALNPKLTGTLGLDYWGHGGEGVGAADFDQYRVVVQLSYALGRDLSTSLGYYHTDRASETQGFGWDENRLALTLNWMQ
jgi:uncharacterized protein (PEP-CTERM system associated)